MKAALSTAQEKSVLAIKICQLLCSVHESFPDLQPVMQELGHVGKKSTSFHPSVIFSHMVMGVLGSLVVNLRVVVA